MHVLVLPSWYPHHSQPLSGVFFREQALALHESGYQVGVVAPILRSIRGITSANIFKVSRPHWECDHGVATLRQVIWALPKYQKLNMQRWLHTGEQLFAQYMEIHGKPDLIHVHSLIYAGALAVRLKQTYGVPYVITEHSSIFLRGLVLKWQWPLIESAVQQSSGNISVSKSLADTLTSLPCIKNKKWINIPNIVDTDFFCRNVATKPTSFRRPFVFLAAAFLTHNKGVHVLIDAVHQYLAGEQFELHIAGDGIERSNLERQARDLGVEKNIRFLGMQSREQMRDLMQECDAFVLSSLHETFGVVLVEALASGKPVIATQSGGPDSIVNGTNGILVPTNNTQALGTAMKNLCQNVGQFNSELIRSNCIAAYGRVAVVKQLSAVYAAALHAYA